MASPRATRLARWVYALAMAQGAFLVLSCGLAYASFRSVRSTPSGVGSDRYVTGFDNAVVSHLTILIAVMALVGAAVIASALTAVISPVRSRAATEALGWSESACLVIALITAMAPPATPGGSWSSPPLGLPYGIGLPGVVAVAGALMVLGSLAGAMAANARSADRR